MMRDADCVRLLQDVLPRMQMRWPGFRKVRRQVAKRIDRRIRTLGLVDADAYRVYLNEHPQEWCELDSACRISISRFYRDRGVFDLLREEVLPNLAKIAASRNENRIRIWSAGCASGEEPYTLKLIWELELCNKFPLVQLQITGTDADPHLLERASLRQYPPSSLKDLPPTWCEQAFTKIGDEFLLRKEVADNVCAQNRLSEYRTDILINPMCLQRWRRRNHHSKQDFLFR